MKRTLLEIVQSILSDMDSEPVNTIGDSVEAQQVASVVQDTFYNIISARSIPEHERLIKLTSLSDNTKPTHFLYPVNVKSIKIFDYNNGPVFWKEPAQFIQDMDREGLMVSDPVSGIPLYVATTRDPSFYTSFDDKYIVCDSYNADLEATLQESKTRCLGVVYPVFVMEDTYVPELDDAMHQYLLAEAKSTCFSIFKSGSDPKIEQAARRLKSYVQNDQLRTELPPKRPLYGR